MGELSRREFIAASAGAAAGVCLGGRAWADEPAERFFEWKPVREGAHAALGFGGNALVVRGTSGVLLIDCKLGPYGQGLRREAGELAGAPVTQVVNTHHHGDHTGGNHAMAGLPILAHARAIPRVRGQMNRYISQLKEAVGQSNDRKGPAADRVRREARELYDRVTKLTPEDFAPTRGVEGPHEIDLGGVKAVLRHFGPGHTDNDLVVHLPELNVVHTGDLVFHKRHPFVDRDSGADTRSWQGAVRGAIELCNEKTVVVPGHGPIADVSALRAQAEYFETARGVVQEAMKAGRSRKEVAELKPGALGGLEGSPAMALAAIFDELSAGAKGG